MTLASPWHGGTGTSSSRERLRIAARSTRALGLTCILFTACATTGELEPAPDAIRRIGQTAVQDGGIVGLSIAVALDGRTVFAEGFGHADLERTMPATAGTVYDAASVGKQFTAVAVMKLVDQGRLSLDSRVRDLVPEAPPHFPNATLDQLLHHTSGFASGELDELNPPAGLDRPRRGVEVLDEAGLREGRVAFPPGETFLYSNSGYLLLGLVVEAASGRPYPDFVAEELFAPAGMTASTVGRRPNSSHLADALHRGEAGVSRLPFIHMSIFGGAGSVCASVTDLLAWELALDEGRVLSAATTARLRSPARVEGTSEAAEIPYGMAQRMGSFQGQRKVGHTGTFEGGSAVLAHYPGARLTIAVLTNTRGLGTPHARAIEAEIARSLLAPVQPEAPLAAVPFTAEQRRQLQGHYDGNTLLEARVEGEHTLLALREGDEVARLVHTGGLQFRDPEQPGARDSFLLDGETAGWWLYEVDGFLMGVSRRVPGP